MTEAAVEPQGSAAIPEAEHRIEPTSQSVIDEALAILEDHKQDWVSLDVEERIESPTLLRYPGRPAVCRTEYPPTGSVTSTTTTFLLPTKYLRPSIFSVLYFLLLKGL